MSDSQNKLFRQEALDRLSSPEQLDKVVKIVNPKAWIPLFTMGSLVAATAIWGVFGRIPVTVSGQGVLIQPRRVVQLQAPGVGRIAELNVQSGDTLAKGDVIGRIAQPSLEQQLEQERNKLAQILEQNQQTNSLSQRQIELEKQNLQQQKKSLQTSLKREEIVPRLREENLKVLVQNRANLQTSLENVQKIAPVLRTKNLETLQQQQTSLKQRIEQIQTLLPTLESRIESMRELLDDQLIRGDALLAAEQEYFSSLSQLSNFETQLQELEVQKVQAEREYLENQNNVDNIKAKLQEISVQEANVQREYSQSLNRLDELNDRLNQLDAAIAKLEQQDIETSISKTNTAEEVKRRIAQLEAELAQNSQIVSKYDGKILELAIVPGQIIDTGTRIGAIQTTDGDRQLVGVVYLADKDGKKIEPQMPIQITPSIVKRERYGGIVGEVTAVSDFPVTPQNIATVVGSQEIANSFTAQGQTPIQVFARLETDPDNSSGYQWSSSKGPELQLTPGTTTTARIKVGELAPVSFVIPLFRSWTGLY